MDMNESANNLPIIDWDFGKKLNEQSPGLTNELLQLFIAQLPAQLTAINKAFQTKNIIELENQLHKLHGACVYCGLVRLKMAIKKCAAAIKQRPTLSPSLLDEMNREIDLIKQEMYTKGLLKH